MLITCLLWLDKLWHLRKNSSPTYVKTLAVRCASCESAWPNLKHSGIHISNIMFFYFKYIQFCQLCLNKVGGERKAHKNAIFTEKKKSSFGLSEPPYYTLASGLPACCTNPFQQRGDHPGNPRLPFPNWLLQPPYYARRHSGSSFQELTNGWQTKGNRVLWAWHRHWNPYKCLTLSKLMNAYLDLCIDKDLLFQRILRFRIGFTRVFSGRHSIWHFS